MANIPNLFSIELPPWVASYCSAYTPQRDIDARMRWVIGAARENVCQRSGGPFAAAVFDEATGSLLALGINVVTRAQISVAHAEILALSLAQQRLGNFSLACQQDTQFQLVSSSDPCAMCLGAICWSGIHSIVCAAEHQDAANIGFDEGPIRDDWLTQLRQRNIQVTTGVCRDDAVAVLQVYAAQGGWIYNAKDCGYAHSANDSKENNAQND